MTDKAVAWLREQIAARLAVAREACGPQWRVAERASCDCCDHVRTQTGALVTTADDRDAPHIALNDPQDTIARCEAELAILDYCLPGEAMAKMLDAGIISGEEYATHEAVGMHVLRLVASAYRHHEGYAEHWGND